MADYSPTGYWAHYEEGDNFVSLPVATFREDSYTGKTFAWVCHEEGYLVRADQCDFIGPFFAVFDHPSGA